MGHLLSEEVIIPVALFAMVVILVWIGHKSKKARIEEKGEIRKRLLDKFNSGQELSEFLATPQGQSFLKDQEADGGQQSPKGRIVGSIGAGVILALLGAAFFGLMYLDRGFIYPAALLTALGIGMLVSAAVSYYLYKKWNMIQ